MNRLIGFSLLLLLPVALIGQSLSGIERKFIARHAVKVCADSNFADARWDHLTTKLSHKKMVLLGEPNHSAKEIFELRNSLIRHLHERLGFTVVLFESGIGELITADLYKSQLSPAQMTSGLIGSWRTKEFRELMQYVKSKRLSIAGFDVQRTGGSFSAILSDVGRRNNLDTASFSNLEQRFGMVRQRLANVKSTYDSVSPGTLALIHDYQNLLARYTRITADTTPQLYFSIATLRNRIKFLRYMLTFVKDKDWGRRWAARDSAMAENIDWLFTNVYKNQKVIVIGHNYHIAKANPEEMVMGSILASRYGQDLYAIGVFAGRGSYGDNFGKPKQMAAIDSTRLDIKHLINELKGTASFVHIPRTPVTGGSVFTKQIIVNDTFISVGGSNQLVLADCFDGLLLLDRISPPDP